VALDALTDANFKKIAAVIDGWATLSRWPTDATGAEFIAELNRTEVLIGWALPELMAASPLKVYLCGSAGMDSHLGHGLESKTGFQICNAGSIMGIPIAEHLFGLMLALTRQINVILRQQAEHRWERRWRAGELYETNVCIVGLGGSGAELARRCSAFNMKVTGVRRDAGKGHPGIGKVLPVSQLCDAVRDADHVFTVIPGGTESRHLFNDRVFAAMKPGACFYSASRGSVTDEAALIRHLQSGHLGGAGLDVFESEPLPASNPLWAMDNVIISPHSAGLSHRLPDRFCELTCANLSRYRRSEPLLNRFDLRTMSSSR